MGADLPYRRLVCARPDLRAAGRGLRNTITSPVSAAALPAMVLAGAGGRTAEEIAGVLHLDDSRDVRVGARAHRGPHRGHHVLGLWTTPFDPAGTRDGPFPPAPATVRSRRPAGGTADVPLMHLHELSLPVVQRDGHRPLRLPYGTDERYGMEILLPGDDSTLPDLPASLDATDRAADLNAPLAALGMGGAFGDGADFFLGTIADPRGRARDVRFDGTMAPPESGL